MIKDSVVKFKNIYLNMVKRITEFNTDKTAIVLILNCTTGVPSIVKLKHRTSKGLEELIEETVDEHDWQLLTPWALKLLKEECEAAL